MAVVCTVATCINCGGDVRCTVQHFQWYSSNGKKIKKMNKIFFENFKKYIYIVVAH